MSEEPAENISGGEDGSGTAAMFEERPAETRAEAVVDELGRRYWQKAYGGRDAFECLVRTILSQNTSDKASQPAHDELMARYDGESDLAETLAEADRAELAETISGAGLYNQKSKMIRGAAREVVAEFGDSTGFDAYVRDEPPAVVRDRLLEIHGVGPKTADCVLLFAGGRGGVFPVDTHVHRIARRLGVAPPDATHEGVREALERDVPREKCGFSSDGYYEVVQSGETIRLREGGVPPEKCGFGHTAMIQFGREYCKARKPACLDGPEACPLYDLCERVGVYPETGEVVDPAETVD